MNKIKLIFTSMMILLVMASCDREPELPVVLFDDLEKGAYPRLLNFDGVFNFLDVGASFVSWDVEFYDEDNGTHVTEYNWTVAYVDNAGTGNDVGETPLLNVGSGDFGTSSSGSGLPGYAASWSMQDVLDVFGFTINDINGGDAFNFFATLKRDDGKEFTTVNTGDNIEGSAPFSGFFRFTMNVVCPSELEGVMDYTTEGWCGATFDAADATVTWVNEGNGVYSLSGGVQDDGADFSFGAYEACYGPGGGLPNQGAGSIRFTDSCNKFGYQGADQWGDTYFINDLSTNGDVMVLDWENTYGEGGVTTFTRQDGKTWPTFTF